MEVILIFLLSCCICIKTVHARRYRPVVDDTLYPYSIDKSVPSHLKYFSQDYLEMELIDDDKVRLSGYGLCTKSLDPMLPLQLDVRTQYLEKSTWVEGPIRLIVPSMCPEFLNPTRFWYNLTKLWTNCPPKEGEKWLVETQIMNVVLDLPPTFSTGPWRGYMLFTQGLLGSTTKFGVMCQLELIEVN